MVGSVPFHSTLVPYTDLREGREGHEDETRHHEISPFFDRRCAWNDSRGMFFMANAFPRLRPRRSELHSGAVGNAVATRSLGQVRPRISPLLLDDFVVGNRLARAKGGFSVGSGKANLVLGLSVSLSLQRVAKTRGESDSHEEVRLTLF